jgi:hypothetical protein
MSKIRSGRLGVTLLLFMLLAAPAWAVSISGFSPSGGFPGVAVDIAGLDLAPAAVVTFNGVPATVTATSATLLTVIVPVGASTGKIQVTVGSASATSTSDFVVARAASLSGTVQSSDGAPLAGARVESDQDATLFTTTAPDGSYTLGGLYQTQSVGLKITASGFVPTYTATFTLQGNQALGPYHLYTQELLNGWGVAANKAVLVGQVLDLSQPGTPVSAATVTTPSLQHVFTPYGASYTSDGAVLGGNATFGNGRFVVPNVDANDLLFPSASKPSWGFATTPSLLAHAGSVSECSIFGLAAPVCSGFSPAGGAAGTSVTLTGSHFNPAPAGNIVKFNGTSATVTAASSGSLTVTVPAGAATGPISVATVGGTALSASPFSVHNVLSASVSGTGQAAGTVTSVPGGISCRASGCAAEFEQGSSVELVPTADAGCGFGNWSGACSGSGPCVLVMSGDQAVGASFFVLQYLKNGLNYYGLIKNAFVGALSGDTIQAQAQSFPEFALLFNRPGVQVTLKCGYDGSFTTNGGYTSLVGKLDIQNGTLRVERLKIK